jgi:hypothetical protein
MDWTSREQPYEVSPDEITGERGFFTLQSAGDARLPASILAAAVKAARVGPSANGYYAFSRYAIGGRILVLEPVPAREERDERRLTREVDRYPGLDRVVVHRSSWIWLSVVEFPCTMYAWHHDGKVYVRELLSAEDWTLTEPGLHGRIEAMGKVRRLYAFRGGIPGYLDGGR